MTETKTQNRTLKKLDIDNEGRITLEGKVVDAKPIGIPLLICEGNKCYTNKKEAPPLKIKDTKNFPREANAYVRSSRVYDFRTIFMRNVPSEWSDILTAVQPYKISDKKE